MTSTISSIDLPPGTGDAALTLTQMAPLSGAVIVTTANDLSLIDARKGLQMFEKVSVPILGIVENMSYFTPPELPGQEVLHLRAGRREARRATSSVSISSARCRSFGAARLSSKAPVMGAFLR